MIHKSGAKKKGQFNFLKAKVKPNKTPIINNKLWEIFAANSNMPFFDKLLRQPTEKWAMLTDNSLGNKNDL